MSDFARSSVSRRQLLVAAGTGALVVGGGLTVAPRAAQAEANEADAMLKKLVGDATPTEGKVQVKLPQIAENGNTVPFTVTVDSPMTEKDYVKAIHVVAEGNPSPGVASFYLTPASGKAEVSMRMRLAKTQNIRAVALMSDGKAYSGKQEVKVTIGGCGG